MQRACRTPQNAGLAEIVYRSTAHARWERKLSCTHSKIESYHRHSADWARRSRSWTRGWRIRTESRQSFKRAFLPPSRSEFFKHFGNKWTPA